MHRSTFLADRPLPLPTFSPELRVPTLSATTMTAAAFRASQHNRQLLRRDRQLLLDHLGLRLGCRPRLAHQLRGRFRSNLCRTRFCRSLLGSEEAIAGVNSHLRPTAFACLESVFFGLVGKVQARGPCNLLTSPKKIFFQTSQAYRFW